MYRILRVLSALVVATAVAGCAAAGALVYTASGEPTVPADYKPENRTTLVLVENYHNPALFQAASERLARDVAAQLKEHKVASIVDPEKLIDFRSETGQQFRKMDITEVARSLKARQVIYVDLVEFSVEQTTGSERIVGRGDAHVKVVDADTGRTLWPPDVSVGHDVRYETSYAKDGDDTDHAAVREQLFQKLGDKIATLFYAAPVDKVDGTEP